MSYLSLSLDQPLNLNKGTISVWFRVPKETIETAPYQPFGTDFEGLDHIIPLVVLGTQPRGPFADFETKIVGYVNNGTGMEVNPVRSSVYKSSRQCPMGPTFIGLSITASGDMPTLAIHIQGQNAGAASQILFSLVKFEQEFRDPGYVHSLWVYNDWSGVSLKSPDALGNAGHSTEWARSYNTGKPEVTPDKWHHLLLSWDVKDKNSSHGYYYANIPDPPLRFTDYHEWVDSSSLLYCALDDKNIKGEDEEGAALLPGIRLPGMAPNATISYNTYMVAASTNVYGPNGSISQGGVEIIRTEGAPDGPPTYSVDLTVKANGVFIPSGMEYNVSFNDKAEEKAVPGICRVEMAEFQLFTGVTLDTGVTANRRAFVDVDGLPVDPTKATSEDDPRPPAVKLLGKKPEVLLHGSSNWKEGYNTGTLGIRIEMIDGKETITKLPGGQFNPVAGIEEYKPDPSLEETTA